MIMLAIAVLLWGLWAIAMTAYALYQRQVIQWVDEREKIIIPLVQCVGSIHYAGAPQHNLVPYESSKDPGGDKLPDVRQMDDARSIFSQPPIQVRSAIDGVRVEREIEVDIPVESVPEAENWTVRGDRVFVKRKEFVPSATGLRQLDMLNSMEATRHSLVEEMRQQYLKLVEWEQTHPVPQSPWQWIRKRLGR